MRWIRVIFFIPLGLKGLNSHKDKGFKKTG